jgi:FMN phosphatase YigB (HAD superfamily)
MKAIVFDFGNVIGFFDHWRALKRLACHTDLSPQQMYDAVYDTELEDAFESGRMTAAEFLEAVRQLWRVRCGDEELTGAFIDIFRPNPEVCSLIPELKPRYTLLLGSNTNELHARHFRKQFEDILRHFDASVLSYQIGARKPRREFFDHCQRLAGCPPHECLFIDDLPANVEGAKACGWRGVVYTTIGELRARLGELGVTVTNNGLCKLN